MLKIKRVTGGKKKAGTRWLPWLFGLTILAAVALFVTHRSEEQALARVVGFTLDPPGFSSASCFRWEPTQRMP